MIARDGFLTSLWQDSIEPYEAGNVQASDNRYEVIVVGGGITGISTALSLQLAGFRVALIEAETLCFGTTGGTTAHLNTLMDTPYTTIIKNFGKEKAMVLAEAARSAIEKIKKQIDTYGIGCGFEEASAYLFSQTGEQTEELDEIGRASLEVGLDVDFVDSIPIPVSFHHAIEVRGQAKFHPLRYVYGLAKAFENAGGVIVQDCRVHAAENNEIIELDTDCGRFFADNLIYATHIPPGKSILDTRCAPYRSYVLAVTLSDNAYPEGLIYDMYDPYHYYRTQEIDGRKFLIAGGEDHKTGHEDNTEECFRHLENHIRKHYHLKEIAYRWSSQYYESVDGLPYIGHMPGQPGRIFVATGFGGNGMIYGTIASQVLTSLIKGEENKLTGLFDPNRIKLIAGFSNFVRENADVVKLYFGKGPSPEKLHEMADIAPGEGEIVKFDDGAIALYKDEQGELHALHPVCTHMNCHVAWNPAERSWDCPCHGSRFDIDGKVLTGPAETVLEKIDLFSLYNQS